MFFGTVGLLSPGSCVNAGRLQRGRGTCEERWREPSETVLMSAWQDQSIAECVQKVDYVGSCGHTFRNVPCDKAFQYANETLAEPSCQELVSIVCPCCRFNKISVHRLLVKGIFLFGAENNVSLIQVKIKFS